MTCSCRCVYEMCRHIVATVAVVGGVRVWMLSIIPTLCSFTTTLAACSQVASKQMVGLYLSVWVRKRLARHVRGVQTTSAATGWGGYVGNKGERRAAGRCRRTLQQHTASLARGTLRAQLLYGPSASSPTPPNPLGPQARSPLGSACTTRPRASCAATWRPATRTATSCAATRTRRTSSSAARSQRTPRRRRWG